MTSTHVSPNFLREDAEILTKLQFYKLSVVSSHLCQSHYVQKINTLLGSYTCKVALMKMWKRNFTVKINTVELIISHIAHRAICFHCFQISTMLSRPRQQTMFGLHGPASLALTDLHQLSWGGQGLRDGVSAPPDAKHPFLWGKNRWVLHLPSCAGVRSANRPHNCNQGTVRERLLISDEGTTKPRVHILKVAQRPVWIWEVQHTY